jgi:hypothetical protein
MCVPFGKASALGVCVGGAFPALVFAFRIGGMRILRRYLWVRKGTGDGVSGWAGLTVSFWGSFVGSAMPHACVLLGGPWDGLGA